MVPMIQEERTMKKILAAICVATLAQAAYAQPTIDWYTIDGGGGTSTGGSFELSGTIGQPDAGVMSGGSFELSGGFWTASPPPAANCDYDFNQDENVDLLDAQQMAQVFVGLIPAQPGWLDGDLNLDENADLTDAQILAAYIVSGICPL
jgi:hypothetical protein